MSERVTSLSGRRVFITGASGGIGGAIARSLHRHGAQLILSGSRLDRLESIAGDLAAQTVIANLSDQGDVDAMCATVRQADIDILINNAGVTADGLALRYKEEDWQRVLAINLTAPFRLIQACLPTMMKRRWGRIINIGSVVGTIGNAGQSAYATSKAGLAGMTRSMAREVAGRQITVNCIAPGFIETAMTADLSDQHRQAMLAAIPCRRFGSVDDVATCAAFLVSNEASYITGQTIHVNGGMAMP